MTILVVTSSTDLALAVAAKTPAVGVAPEDLESLLQSADIPDRAIVDVGTDKRDIDGVLNTLGRVAPASAVVVVGTSEHGLAEYPSGRISFVPRPFTVDRLLQALGEPPNKTFTASTPQPAPAADAVVASSGRHRSPSVPTRHASSKPPSLQAAVESILAHDDHYSVAEVSTVVVDILGESFDTASAVLVLDDDGWHVTAGRGLRPVETRAVFPRANWLARRLQTGDAAVIVEGTDIVRQELSGLPHIHLDHWMATAPASGDVMVIMAREDVPFSVDDAILVRDLIAETVPMLTMALRLRTLARQLQPLAQ